jgi:Bacterial cellulose synthase subunit
MISAALWTIAIHLAYSAPAPPPAAPVAEPAPPEPPPVHLEEVVFGKDMYVEKDIMLHGLRGYGSVDFRIPQQWELTDDPEVQIYFEHSKELLPDQSDLTLLLNDVAIGTVSLDSTNTTQGVMIVKLPRSNLQPYNRITFAGTHRRTDACQDPYDMALWTRISRYSKLIFPVELKKIEGELLEYPYPFFDEFGFGPVELTWVFGTSVSDATLTAAGVLGFGMGRVSDYRGVAMSPSVATLEDVKTHALLVGTTEEQPLIGQLVDASNIGDVKGLIAVVPNPHNPNLAVLIVTGWSGEDVLSAAQALGSNPRYQRYSGPQALVPRVTDTRPPASRLVPKPIHQDEVTLLDIGLKDETVRGYYAPRFRVPIVMDGDAAVKPTGGVTHLNYGYSAGLDTNLSTMEVSLNGVTLRSVPLDSSAGETQTSLRVRLPSEMVAPHSFLDVVFHLFPQGYDACEWHIDDTHWATLYASSTISIPFDNYAKIPDLGRLRYRGWPFNLENGPVEIVVADDPSGDDVSAAFALAARLGAWSVAEDPELSVVMSKTAERSPVLEHRIVLAGDRPHSWFNTLVAEGVLTAPGDVQSRATANRGSGFKYIEERLHPRSKDRLVMVLRADSAGGLTELVQSLSEGRTLSNLDRNLAMFRTDKRIQTAVTAEPVQVGEVPRLTQAQLLLQRYWAPWGVVAVICAMFFAGVARRWANRRGGEV